MTMARAARAAYRLDHAFQLGRSVEQPGIITAAHTATWHMAGMIEQLRSLRADRVDDHMQHEELSAGPVSPGAQPT